MRINVIEELKYEDVNIMESGEHEKAGEIAKEESNVNKSVEAADVAEQNKTEETVDIAEEPKIEDVETVVESV